MELAYKAAPDLTSPAHRSPPDTIQHPPQRTSKMTTAETTPADPGEILTQSEFQELSKWTISVLLDDTRGMNRARQNIVSDVIASTTEAIIEKFQTFPDTYFLNHKSQYPGDPSNGILPGGYYLVATRSLLSQFFNPNNWLPASGERLHQLGRCYADAYNPSLTKNRLVIFITASEQNDKYTYPVDKILWDIACHPALRKAPEAPLRFLIIQAGTDADATRQLELIRSELSTKLEKPRDIAHIVTSDDVHKAGGFNTATILRAILEAISPTSS